MKRLLLLVGIIATSISSRSQTPSLEKDIITGSVSSDPSSLTFFGDKFYLGVKDAAHGRELWSYNPATTKDTIISDLKPGASGGFGQNFTEPMAVFNNKLYFDAIANSSSSFHQLKAYDGTNVSTMLDSLVHIIGSFCILNNKLYFNGDTAGTGGGFGTYYNLYSYDGTNKPYRCPSQIGAGNTSGVFPLIIPYKNKIYYAGGYQKGTGLGQELFAYDPASNTASLVQLINAGKTQTSDPRGFVVGGSKLYFVAGDSATGIELYSYDGSVVNRLTDIVPGTGSGVSNLTTMAFFKGAVYFNGFATTTGTKLYKWDTASQTVSLVATIANTTSICQNFYATPNNLYFRAGTTTAGYELWKYNGTTCTMVSDLNPGTGDGMGQCNVALYQGSVYFNGNNGTTGNELYKVYDTPTGSGGTAVVQAAGWKGTVTLYPNPATTTATLSIAAQSPQSIRVFLTDMQGREVWASALQTLSAGEHELRIPMQGLAAGQYFYRLSNYGGCLLASGAVVKE